MTRDLPWPAWVIRREGAAAESGWRKPKMRPPCTPADFMAVSSLFKGGGGGLAAALLLSGEEVIPGSFFLLLI